MSLYDELGVPTDATAGDIKAAYRKRAKATHPDANKDDPTAAEKFGALTKAYEVLSDDAARARYDQTGATEKPSDIDARAEQIIAEMLSSIFNEVDNAQEGQLAVYEIYEDVVAMMRKIVAEGQSKMKIARGKAMGEEARWKKRRPKFKGPIAERLIDNQIRAAKLRQDEISAEMKAAERACEMLEDYEHEPDPRPEPPQESEYVDILIHGGRRGGMRNAYWRSSS